MASNCCTRTGLFPVMMNKEDKTAKSESKLNSVSKTKVNTGRTPQAVVSSSSLKTSAIKRKSDVLGNSTKQVNRAKVASAAKNPGGVRPKGTAWTEEQESLRDKLNQWLVAKGKTPRKCKHLMFFNAQVSAKKKTENKPETLVDRTISQNLLSRQLATLQNEEQQTVETEDKKVDGSLPNVELKESPEKENKKTRRSIRFLDEVTEVHAGPDYKAPCDPLTPVKDLETSDVDVEKDSTFQIDTSGEETMDPVERHNRRAVKYEELFNTEALKYLDSLLRECLMLYHAGCTVDRLLPWINDIEKHLPQALTYAPFYVAKARLLSGSPQLVLDTFCQAVKNKAEPADILAGGMQASLSLLLVQPPAQCPPPRRSNRNKRGNTSCDLASNPPQDSTFYEIVSYDSEEYPIYENIRYETKDPTYENIRYENESTYSEIDETHYESYATRYENESNRHTGDIVAYSSSSSDDSHIADTTSELTFSPDVCVRRSRPKDASHIANTTSDLTFSPDVCLRRTQPNVSVSDSIAMSSFGEAVTASTPLDQPARTASMPPCSLSLGSKVCYRIGSTMPLLKLSTEKEASPVAVVTPVRRSTRLSHKPLTPRSSLRREIDSVSDLTDAQRQHMLFQNNPAIGGN